MIERLANVIYWAFSLLALGILGVSAFLAAEQERIHLDGVMVIIMVVIGFWLFGLAIRYVLTGRGIRKPQ